MSIGTADAAASEEFFALAELLPEPERIHSDILDQVAFDLTGVRPLATRLESEHTRLAESSDRIVRAQALHALYSDSKVETEAKLFSALASERDASVALSEARSDLGAFAVETFVGYETDDLEQIQLEATPSAKPTLAAAAETILSDARDAADSRYSETVAAVELLRREVADLEAKIAAADQEQMDAEASAADASEQIGKLLPEFELALLSSPVLGADFPIVVLDAYYRAELTMSETYPACQVQWEQLAGIGRVETRHGTFGGAHVGPDGRTNNEILGPVLDGDPWKAIADTDGGRYDGNTSWDRAVGPMQFIPGSWARFGQDGNLDGEQDPHNMYDAALAAAHHLCGSTSGLADPGRLSQALLGYNRSVPYGVTVMAHAEAYRSKIGLNSTRAASAALVASTD